MLLLKDTFNDNNTITLLTQRYPDTNNTGNSYEAVTEIDWTLTNNKATTSAHLSPAGIDVGEENIKISFKGIIGDGSATSPYLLYYFRNLAVSGNTGVNLSISTTSISIGTNSGTIQQYFTPFAEGEHLISVNINGASMYVDVDGKRYITVTSGIPTAGTYFVFQKVATGTETVTLDDLLIETIQKQVTPRSSWWSYSKLQSDVVRGIKDGSVATATIQDYINEAYREIYFSHRWDDRKRTDYMPMYAGVDEYELPVEADDVIVLSAGSWALKNRGDIAQYLIADEGSGTPTSVRFEGNTIKLNPTPSESSGYRELLKMEYYAELGYYNTNGEFTFGELTVDTDYPALHPVLHPLISLKAQILAIEDIREYDGVYQAKTARYTKQMRAAKYKVVNPTRFPNRAEILR